MRIILACLALACFLVIIFAISPTASAVIAVAVILALTILILSSTPPANESVANIPDPVDNDDDFIMCVVNVDKPTDKALIHFTNCVYYKNRAMKDRKDGGWTTEVASISEARKLGKASGVKTVRRARCCT